MPNLSKYFANTSVEVRVEKFPIFLIGFLEGASDLGSLTSFSNKGSCLIYFYNSPNHRLLSPLSHTGPLPFEDSEFYGILKN